LEPSDCVYLLPFNDQVGPGIWGAPTSHSVRALIHGTAIGGDTALYDALMTGLQVLWDASTSYSIGGITPCSSKIAEGDMVMGGGQPRRRRALVVLTDGDDRGSRALPSDVLDLAARSQIPVFPVAIGEAVRARITPSLGSWSQRRQRLSARLEAVAQASGGILIKEPRRNSLRAAYEQLLSFMKAAYVLGFTPRRDSSTDELTWQPVEVHTTNPNHEVMSRSGYYRRRGNPNAARRLIFEGRWNLERGRPRAALAAFTGAVQVDGEGWEGHYYSGVASGLLGDLRSAYSAGVRAEALAPERAEIQALLAITALDLARYEVAWEHAIRAAHGGVDVSGVLEELRQRSTQPESFRVRLTAPTIYVLNPDVGDVALRSRMAPVVLSLRRLILASKEIGLASRTAADYVVTVEVEDGQEDGMTLKGTANLWRNGRQDRYPRVRQRWSLAPNGQGEAAAALEAFLRDVIEAVR